MVSPFEEILNGETVPSHTPLKVICPNGELQLKDLGNFNNGKGCSCPLCRPIRTVKSLKGIKQNRIKDIVEARKRFREKGFELISTEWNGIETIKNGKRVIKKYDLRCLACGYESLTVVYDILRGLRSCPVCNGAKGSLETFTQWTKENRPEYEISQNQTYEGNRSTVKILCLRHNKIFDIFPGNFKRGANSCPECTYEQNAENTRNLRKQFDTIGKNNPKFNGLSPLRNYLRTQLEDWKRLSMKEHDYKCVVTGEPFDVIHHAYGFNEIVIDTIELTGLPIHETVEVYSQEELELIRSTFLKLHDFYGPGFPLSTDIHDEFHSMYRYGGNTNEQFVEFLTIKGHEELAAKVNESEIKRKKIMKIKYPEFSKLA
jgi:hypothetical protein